MASHLSFLCILSLFLVIATTSYQLPPKRRLDYPLDQDCHLCHAVIIESMKRIGSVISLENTRKVLNSVCSESSFEGYDQYLEVTNSYPLSPDEIRYLCDRFIKDHNEKLQISIFSKQMNKYRESVDEHVCNELQYCPNGWYRYDYKTSQDNSYMDDEL